MSRTPLLALALLVAVGGVAWLLLSGTDPAPRDPDDVVQEPAEEAPARGDDEQGPASPDLAPGPGAQARVEELRRQPKWPIRSTDKIPRGGLDVLVVGEDGTPLEETGVVVHVERDQTAFWSAPLGIYDADSRTWRYRNLPIGRVKVTVTGEHLIATDTMAVVRTKRVEPVRVDVKTGGTIAYAATYYGGEKPKTMKLTLRRKGQQHPIRVWYRPSNGGAQHTATAKVGADGRIQALEPGTYVLRAESEEQEVDVQEVEVRPGETVDVQIQLRK